MRSDNVCVANRGCDERGRLVASSGSSKAFYDGPRTTQLSASRYGVLPPKARACPSANILDAGSFELCLVIRQNICRIRQLRLRPRSSGYHKATSRFLQTRRRAKPL